MNENKNVEPLPEDISPEKPIEEQVQEQTGQKKIRVRIDERNLQTSYASGFRPIAYAEEVILDFGLNLLQPATQQQDEREMVFQANNRIIMNYYSAKRLTLTLGHIIRRFEQEFGELELNAAKRRIGQTQ